MRFKDAIRSIIGKKSIIDVDFLTDEGGGTAGNQKRSGSSPGSVIKDIDMPLIDL